jgi:hypothetical protein
MASAARLSTSSGSGRLDRHARLGGRPDRQVERDADCLLVPARHDEVEAADEPLLVRVHNQVLDRQTGSTVSDRCCALSHQRLAIVPSNSWDGLMVPTIRTLAMDAVQKTGSGYPARPWRRLGPPPAVVDPPVDA